MLSVQEHDIGENIGVVSTDRFTAIGKTYRAQGLGSSDSGGANPGDVFFDSVEVLPPEIGRTYLETEGVKPNGVESSESGSTDLTPTHDTAGVKLLDLVSRDLAFWAHDSGMQMKDFIGEGVILAGLKASDITGRFAKILSVNSNGRIHVRCLCGQNKGLAVKPENLFIFLRCPICRVGDPQQITYFSFVAHCSYCRASAEAIEDAATNL